MSLLIHSESKACDCADAWDAAVDTNLGLMSGSECRLGAAVVHVCAPAMNLDLTAPVNYRDSDANLNARVLGFYQMLRAVVERYREIADSDPYLQYPSELDPTNTTKNCFTFWRTPTTPCR